MIVAGAPLLIFDEIDSTNDEARRRAERGETGPIWLMARRQTAGKGRRGRSWTSVPGNLLLTYFGVGARPPADIALLGFVAGLALADVVEAIAGPGRATLKWPNDLLIDGRKAAGILLECGARPGGTWFAIGVGLNIAGAPDDTQPTAALRDLLPAESAAPAPEAVARDLADRMAHWSVVLDRDGFAPLRTAWAARGQGMNAPVRVALASGEVAGIARGLSETGELLLEISGGEMRRIAAGDIYFAPPAPQTA